MTAAHARKRSKITVGRVALIALAVAVFAVNIGTLLVVFLASLSDTAYTIFPPRGITLRWYRELTGYRPAVVYSLRVATVASTIATALAAGAALVLVRGRLRAKGTILNALLLPLLVPSSVFALAILVVLVKLGWRPGFWPLTLALAVHTVPFAVRIILSGLQNLDWTLEAAARTLGATRRTAWLKVMLPVAAPSVVMSWALCFILTFDDSVISIFLTSTRERSYGAEILVRVSMGSPSVAAAGSAIAVVTLVFVGIIFVIYRIQRRLTGAGAPMPIE